MPEHPSIAQQLLTAFPALMPIPSSAHQLVQYRVDTAEISEIARYVHDKLHGRLALLFAVDLRPQQALTQLQYLFAFAARQAWLLLTLELADGERLFPSITPSIHAAQWYEREIRDM